MASDMQQYESPVSDEHFVADEESPDDASYYEQYRALSISAIACLIFALLSPLTFFDWSMGLIPMAGIVLGVFALVKIRRYEDELSGALIARIGITLSLLMLVGGWGWLSFDHLTEVPEGYQRLPYSEVQTNAGRSERQTIEYAMQFDGKRVFIKGYTLPSTSGKNMKEFVIVPDRGTCCFGGSPEITDMIRVTLEDPHRVDYSVFQRKFGGVFRVTPQDPHRVEKYGAVVYELKADYVK
ncbi:MAG: DUF4190 domain-containing protein [Planctomycetes bacterium]|nr:DUF4190 domain-containing protein [Planctomycetota bacterium]